MQDKDFDMKLKQAECPVKVAEIVEKTIRAVYPHYYPSGAVQFFLDLHNEQRIREAFIREDIYFAVTQGKIVGTGSIRGNEICRLFILPEYQAKGYGSRIMDLLEDMVFRKYHAVHIDASFPAEGEGAESLLYACVCVCGMCAASGQYSEYVETAGKTAREQKKYFRSESWIIL